MTLYLDTEFNGHGGELISLALVSSDNSFWYEVVELSPTQIITAWGADNVIPVLDRKPISHEALRASLYEFLAPRVPREKIIADWPADFGYLMELLAGPTYDQAFKLDINMKLIWDSNPQSKRPHNALWDAHALREWCEAEGIV